VLEKVDFDGVNFRVDGASGHSALPALSFQLQGTTL